LIHSRSLFHTLTIYFSLACAKLRTETHPTHPTICLQVRTEYEAKRWYKVNMLFDWASQVFDLIVDGVLIGTRIPFEDRMVQSLGYVYISNSHPDSETLWDRFQCSDESSVPSMELEGESYLNHGIWQVSV
jgi:hypothetical protein